MKQWLKEGRSMPYVTIVLIAVVCSICNRMLQPNKVILSGAIAIVVAVLVLLLVKRDAKLGRLSRE